MRSSSPSTLVFFVQSVSWFFFSPFLSLLCYPNQPFSFLRDLLLIIRKTFARLLFSFSFDLQCLWSSEGFVASSPLLLQSAPVILLSLSLLFFVSLPCLSLRVTLVSLVLLLPSLFLAPFQSLVNSDLTISSQLSFIPTIPPLKRRQTDPVLIKHTARCFSRNFARHFMCLSIFFLSLPSVYSLETTGRLLPPFRLDLYPFLSSSSSSSLPTLPFPSSLLFFLHSRFSSFISSSFCRSLPRSSFLHLSPYSSSLLPRGRRRRSASSCSYCPRSFSHPLLSFRGASLSLREKQGFSLSSSFYPHRRGLPFLPAICPLSSFSACFLESTFLLLSSHRKKRISACFSSSSSFSPSCLSESSSPSLPCWGGCVSSLKMTNQSVAHKKQTSILSFLTRGGGGVGMKKSRGEEEEAKSSSSSSSSSSSLSSKETPNTSYPVIPQKKKKSENEDSFSLVATEKKKEGKREMPSTFSPGKTEGENSDLHSPDKKRMKKSVDSSKNEASLSLRTARPERERQAKADEDQDERRIEKNAKISSPASDSRREEKKKKEEENLFNHRDKDDAVDKKEEKDIDMLVEVEGDILRSKKKGQLRKEGSSETDSFMKEEDQEREREESQAEGDDRKLETKNRVAGVDQEKGSRKEEIRERQGTQEDANSSTRGDGLEGGTEDAARIKDYESISEAAESDRESIDSAVSTSQTQDEANRPLKKVSANSLEGRRALEALRRRKKKTREDQQKDINRKARGGGKARVASPRDEGEEEMNGRLFTSSDDSDEDAEELFASSFAEGEERGDQEDTRNACQGTTSSSLEVDGEEESEEEERKKMKKKKQGEGLPSALDLLKRGGEGDEEGKKKKTKAGKRREGGGIEEGEEQQLKTGTLFACRVSKKEPSSDISSPLFSPSTLDLKQLTLSSSPPSQKKSSRSTPSSESSSSSLSSPPPPILFEVLVNAFDKIEQAKASGTGSNKKQTVILTNLFRILIYYAPSTLVKAVYICLNKVAPDYLGKEVGVGESLILKAMAETYGRTEANLKKELQHVEDLGRIAEQSCCMTRTLFPPPRLTIEGVYDLFLGISQCAGRESVFQKRNLLKRLLIGAKGAEPKYIIRFLQQRMRTGASHATVYQALAFAFFLTRNSQGLSSPPIADTRRESSRGDSPHASSSSSDLKESKEREEQEEKEEMKDGEKNSSEKKEKEEAISSLSSSSLLSHGDTSLRREISAMSPVELEQALSSIERSVRRALCEVPNLEIVISYLLQGCVGEALNKLCVVTPGIPIQPMLAKPTRGFSEVLERLKEVEAFTCEYKYDGERIQLHLLKKGVKSNPGDASSSLFKNKRENDGRGGTIGGGGGREIMKTAASSSSSDLGKKKSLSASSSSSVLTTLLMQKTGKLNFERKGKKDEENLSSLSTSPSSSGREGVVKKDDSSKEKDQEEEHKENRTTTVENRVEETSTPSPCLLNPSPSSPSSLSVTEVKKDSSSSCSTTQSSSSPLLLASSSSSASSSFSTPGPGIERVRLFSRNLEEITGKYPDVIDLFLQCLRPDVEECILDGEVVAYDEENKRILPFQTLTRRKRKDVSQKNIEVPVAVFIFDCMRLNGECQLNQPLESRRKKALQALDFSKHPRMLQATHREVHDSQEFEDFLNEAVQNNCEGLMVKTLRENATYEPSKRSLNWLKVKKDYVEGLTDSVDLVPIGAFYGKGKRSGTFGTYLLAVYNPTDETFQTVCKAATGFSEEALEQHYKNLSNQIISHKKPYYQVDEKMTPDVWLEASQVWECRAADLSISPVHTAALGERASDKGIGLRFPRFLRVREDKNPEQATTSTQIVEMYDNQFRQAKDLKHSRGIAEKQNGEGERTLLSLKEDEMIESGNEAEEEEQQQHQDEEDEEEGD